MVESTKSYFWCRFTKKAKKCPLCAGICSDCCKMGPWVFTVFYSDGIIDKDYK